MNGHSIVNFSIFLIEIAHYCFALSPRVSESYKLCHLMIVMSRFVRSRFQNHVDKLNHRIHNCLLTLLKNELSGQKVCGVERLNVLLTLSEIDRQYLPSSEIISGLVFDTNNSNDYFNVIVALFIARDDQRHENIRATAIEQAKKILDQRYGVYSCAESLHLFLDLLSCPYISKNEKETIIKLVLTKLRSDHNLKNPPSQSKISILTTDILKFCNHRVWFVDWSNIDLLMNLQRKLLKEAY